MLNPAGSGVRRVLDALLSRRVLGVSLRKITCGYDAFIFFFTVDIRFFIELLQN